MGYAGSRLTNFGPEIRLNYKSFTCRYLSIIPYHYLVFSQEHTMYFFQIKIRNHSLIISRVLIPERSLTSSAFSISSRLAINTASEDLSFSNSLWHLVNNTARKFTISPGLDSEGTLDWKANQNNNLITTQKFRKKFGNRC